MPLRNAFVWVLTRFRQKATSINTPSSPKPPQYLQSLQMTNSRPRQPSKTCSRKYAAPCPPFYKISSMRTRLTYPFLARSPHRPTQPSPRLRIPPNHIRPKIQQPHPPPRNPPRPPPRAPPPQILHHRRPPARQPPLHRPLRHLRLPQLEPRRRGGRLHARREESN